LLHHSTLELGATPFLRLIDPATLSAPEVETHLHGSSADNVRVFLAQAHVQFRQFVRFVGVQRVAQPSSRGGLTFRPCDLASTTTAFKNAVLSLHQPIPFPQTRLNSGFTLEKHRLQKMSTVQERIAAAKKETEQLKERIRVKRDALADVPSGTSFCTATNHKFVTCQRR